MDGWFKERWEVVTKTLPKAQRTRGLSSSYQSNFLRSYHNFTNLDQISSSESRLKNQFLNQTSASPINLKFKISTKHSFRIATKIQLHNLYKTSASKCWTNSSFKILPELQLQNLDQPLCSKSEQKFSFMTKRQLQICNKLLPTRSSSSTSPTVTTSTCFELASLQARVASIKFTKRYGVSQSVSESVSEWQAEPMIRLGSDKKATINKHWYQCHDFKMLISEWP